MAAVATATAGGKAKPAAEEAAREPFGAYLYDDQARPAVLEFARQRGWPADEISRGGLEGALRTLSVAPPPQMLDERDMDDVLSHLRNAFGPPRVDFGR